MTEYTLSKIFPTPLSSQFDFVATFDDASYTVFDTNFFVTEIYTHFATRKIVLADTDPAAALVELFNIWKNSRNDNYGRRMYALSIDYDPLENYNGVEETERTINLTHGERVGTSHGLTVGTSHGESVAHNFNNLSEVNNETGSITDANSVYGVNSSSAVPDSVNTTTYNDHKNAKTTTGGYTDTHSGTDTITHGGTDTETHSGTDNTVESVTLNRHGNLGVTTSQQMLASDLDFLKYDIALFAVCDFIDRYTYTSEGVTL